MRHKQSSRAPKKIQAMRGEAARQTMRGKAAGLIVIGDRPLVAETPESLLDDDTTPTARFFIRNNGLLPERTRRPEQWKVTIDGEVEQPLSLTLAELKSNLKR